MKGGKMTKKYSIILLCSVAIVAAALFAVSQLMAMGQAKPRSSRDYQAVTTYNELEVAAPKLVAPLKKKYERNSDGCVTTVWFFNDLANCTDKDCVRYQEDKSRMQKQAQEEEKKGEWILAYGMDKEDRPIKDPVIWGKEKLVGAGTTRGESDVCGDWRFTVAGSPGWDCDYVAGLGRIVCSCIGFYVGKHNYPQYYPPGYCCDPTGCVPTPTQ